MTNKNALAHLSICLDKDADMLEVDDDTRMAFKKDPGYTEDEVGGMVMSDLRRAPRILASWRRSKGIMNTGKHT